MGTPVIISFGGGKGGIGKSTVVSNIGALLTRKKFSVGFIDADLGGANLHICLGVKRPKFTFHDYLTGAVANLSDILEKNTVPDSWLISGASDIIDLANPHYLQKQKIITNLKKLPADYILLDLGAGSSNHVVDFFVAFNNSVIVSDGLPTSIENAYSFLKNGVIRGIQRLFPGNTIIKDAVKRFSSPRDSNGFASIHEMCDSLASELPHETRRVKEWLASRKTFLILNMVKHQNDILVGKKFIAFIKKYLGISMTYTGYIVYDANVRRSIREMKPLVLNNPDKEIAGCFEAITSNLVAMTKNEESFL